MILRRFAKTIGAVATVAFCAENVTNNATKPPAFQRQNSAPEKRQQLQSHAILTSSRALQLYRDNDWKEYQTAKDVKVSYKDSPHENGEIYRLEMTVASPIDTVVNKLITLGRRVQWDPDVEEHIIEELADGAVVLHTTYLTSGLVAKLVSPRDFCRIETVIHHPDGLVSLANGQADHPGCQELEGFVRGDLFASGMFCAPSKEDSSKTDIVFIVGSDSKVSIPGYLLRLTNCRKCFEMADLMKLAVEKAPNPTQ